MQPGPPRRRRPRPLPDIPVDSLLARSKDLTKGWLIALVEDQPLEDAPLIRVQSLASDGPWLCEAILLALADDAQLRRLEPGGDAERLVAKIGSLTGVNGPVAVSAAVESLRSVIWAALRDAFTDASQEQLFTLSERLAVVAELVRAAALRSVPAEAGEEAVLAEEGIGGVWEQLLSATVARAVREGHGLALLMVELEDVERLLAISTPEEAAAALSAFDSAVWSAAGEHDGEVLSDSGRAWVIVPEIAPPVARTLAERIDTAVTAAGKWRGAPLKASVGVAVLGEDGEDAPSLLAAAEEARFAAQASGLGPAG